MQNKQLITDRVLTTDDSSSEDDYDDIDKMEKNLDALFTLVQSQNLESFRVEFVEIFALKNFELKLFTSF